MGQIQYSDKYFDDTNEYRHVVLPSEVAKLLPKNRLLTENEWRAIGVQQSRGWVHYAIHRPEPHIMLFRRPLNYQQQQENQSLLAKWQRSTIIHEDLAVIITLPVNVGYDFFKRLVNSSRKILQVKEEGRQLAMIFATVRTFKVKRKGGKGKPIFPTRGRSVKCFC